MKRSARIASTRIERRWTSHCTTEGRQADQHPAKPWRLPRHNRRRDRYRRVRTGSIQHAVWQQSDRSVALQIANDRPVGLAASKCKIIDTNDRQLVTPLDKTPTHHPQRCVAAHRYHQANGKSCRRPATQCKTKMMDDRLKSLGAPTTTSRDAFFEVGGGEAEPKGRSAPG